ncbi:hypothetical protein GCM10011591_34390 [Nocardia camponoti]|uniref:Uncharacterized protein n=1 Tax=Nocardia camponoti TaxID=1616106 RepID=A0A917QNC7_9NOCA|nr:hypothetical protein GCM10011591_34390 [Nocardia camponoti]
MPAQKQQHYNDARPTLHNRMQMTFQGNSDALAFTAFGDMGVLLANFSDRKFGSGANYLSSAPRIEPAR